MRCSLRGRACMMAGVRSCMTWPVACSPAAAAPPAAPCGGALLGARRAPAPLSAGSLGRCRPEVACGLRSSAASAPSALPAGAIACCGATAPDAIGSSSSLLGAEARPPPPAASLRCRVTDTPASVGSSICPGAPTAASSTVTCISRSLGPLVAACTAMAVRRLPSEKALAVLHFGTRGTAGQQAPDRKQVNGLACPIKRQLNSKYTDKHACLASVAAQAWFLQVQAQGLVRTWTMTVVADVRRARAAAGALGPGGSASVGATCRWFHQTPYRPEGGVQMHDRTHGLRGAAEQLQERRQSAAACMRRPGSPHSPHRVARPANQHETRFLPCLLHACTQGVRASCTITEALPAAAPGGLAERLPSTGAAAALRAAPACAAAAAGWLAGAVACNPARSVRASARDRAFVAAAGAAPAAADRAGAARGATWRPAVAAADPASMRRRGLGAGAPAGAPSGSSAGSAAPAPHAPPVRRMVAAECHEPCAAGGRAVPSGRPLPSLTLPAGRLSDTVMGERAGVAERTPACHALRTAGACAAAGAGWPPLPAPPAPADRAASAARSPSARPPVAGPAPVPSRARRASARCSRPRLAHASPGAQEQHGGPALAPWWQSRVGS